MKLKITLLTLFLTVVHSIVMPETDYDSSLNILQESQLLQNETETKIFKRQVDSKMYETVLELKNGTEISTKKIWLINPGSTQPAAKQLLHGSISSIKGIGSLQFLTSIIFSDHSINGSLILPGPGPLTEDYVNYQFWKQFYVEWSSKLGVHMNSDMQMLLESISNELRLAYVYPVPGDIENILEEVHKKLSSGTRWYSIPVSSSAFTLCGPKNGQTNECVHIQDKRYEDNQRLLTKAVDLTSMDSMMMVEDENQKVTMLDPNGGTFCIAFRNKGKTKNGNSLSQALGIFRSDTSSQCKKTIWDFKVNKFHGLYSLYGVKKDGSGPEMNMCLHKEKSFIPSGGRCIKNGDTKYRYKLIIPSNDVTGGYNSGNPYNSLAMQMMSFWRLATAHMNVLLELHLRKSESDSYYGALFKRKSQEYLKVWDYYLDIYTTYATVVAPADKDLGEDSTFLINSFRELRPFFLEANITDSFTSSKVRIPENANIWYE